MSARRLVTLRAALEEVRAEHKWGAAREDVERVSRALHPYLYDGTFEENLAKLSLFTEAQAVEATTAKREEHELEIERALILFLNPPPWQASSD